MLNNSCIPTHPVCMLNNSCIPTHPMCMLNNWHNRTTQSISLNSIMTTPVYMCACDSTHDTVTYVMWILTLSAVMSPAASESLAGSAVLSSCFSDSFSLSASPLQPISCVSVSQRLVSQYHNVTCFWTYIKFYNESTF